MKRLERIMIANGLTVFYWLGNASSNRELSMGDTPWVRRTPLASLAFCPACGALF